MSVQLPELAARESEQVEWKQNVADPDDVVRTIVAFANDLPNLGGGYVVCGATEIKDAHGFAATQADGMTAGRCKEVEGRVLAACLTRVSPPIIPLVEELPAAQADHRLLVFVVPATGHAHTFRSGTDSGRYYVRVGRSTREARNGLMRELLVRKRALEPWDRRSPAGATLADLDLLALRELLTRLGIWDSERPIDDWLDPNQTPSPFVPSLCARESLTGILRPRNFALLLCGVNFQRFTPEAHTILSVYPGTDRATDLSERLELAGTLLDQAQQIMRHLTPEARVLMDKTVADTNVSKYPLRAIQEVVVNALVHRDYEQHHPLRVTVFSDRIEVSSPGGLPPSVHKDKLLLGQALPVWRNQALAWVANKLKLAQAEGQGMATILRTMREGGCAPPQFAFDPERVTCVLPAHVRGAQVDRALGRR